MQRDIKKLSGIMNLDDSNEIIPSSHHKEARNGVFKGEESELRFTAIRGNYKVTNELIVVNDCRMSGTASFVPNCTIAGNATYIPKCELEGMAVKVIPPITMNSTVTCVAYIGSGKIVVDQFAGGSGVYSYISISATSSADALSRLNSSATRFAITTSSYTFQNLNNSVFYVAIMDSVGLKGFRQISVTCEEEPLNFILNHVCDSETGTSTVEAKTFTGGSGQYQISNMLHTSAANALAGTFIDVASATVQYFSAPDGTWYVALRDKNNTGNKITRSIVSDCVVAGQCSCYTITNTTGNTLNIEFYNCEANITSVGIPGGSTDWICVANNTVPAQVEGLTITKCSPAVPCTTSPSCYFCGTTDPVWADQGFNTCVSCTTYDVYRDINPNSVSFNKYKVNGVIGTTTAPVSGNCNTSAEYSESVGTYHLCIGGQVKEYPIYKNTNICFTGNQYSRGTSGTITYATNPVNDYPDTDRIMVNQGFNTCYNCVTYPVFRDKNSCSPTWNEYFVNDTISLGQTAPPSGDCSVAADWRSINETTCYECSNQTIYRDYGVCSPTKDKYRIGLTGPVSTTKPTVGACSTTPTLTSQNYTTCYNCGNYAVLRDTNPCSSTYNNYILNQPPSQTFINVGNTAPANGSCITTANWQNEGARVCIDCTSYQPQKDINPCSSTYNNTRNVDGVYGAAPCNTTTPSYTAYEGLYYYCSNGTVYSASVYSNTNPCYSGISTAQYRVDFGGGNYIYYGVGNNPVNSYPNTNANWTIRPIEVYWECDGTTKYYQEIDINSCSPTGGQTRRGSLYATNSTDCGYVPVTCTSYEIYNPDMNYDVYYDYEQCGGSIVYDTLGPNMSIVVCSSNFPTAGGGVVTPLGSCSV